MNDPAEPTSRPESCPRPHPVLANPYASGILLGLIILAMVLTLGAPPSATQALTRLDAALVQALWPGQTPSYFRQYLPGPLNSFTLFMALGLILGSLFAFISKTRSHGQKMTPPRMSIQRIIISGLLCGLGAALAGGGLLDLGLSGGSMLLTGSAVFIICLLIGGLVQAKIFPGQAN